MSTKPVQECNPQTPAFQADPAGPTDVPVSLKSIDGLYLHIPFCFHKCHYCDFYSLVEPAGKPDRQESFTDALIRELAQEAKRYRLTPKTIFVGGGTPTLLRPDLWARLLQAMRDMGVLDEVSEFTVEANPETVTAELMGVLTGGAGGIGGTGGGVNRVSLGAQSFDLRHLKTLERWHDPQTVPKAVKIVREAGITNFNLDLIFAIPGQTIDSLNHDLDTALSLEPTHLSCYSLIFEPNTPLTQKMKMGRISPVGEDLERQMYDHVMRRLGDAGFEHYEISNWARRSSTDDLQSSISHSPYQTLDPRAQTPLRCQHNMVYWTNQNWLGLGPSAASHLDGKRWKNEPHLGRYLAGSPDPPTIDHEELPLRQSIGEQIMLGLRLREGLLLNWIDQHIPPDDERHRTIDEMIQINMLERTATHLRLTRNGLFLADSVIAKLL